MTDTIFAHSSGRPPAAIAVIRISGPDAGGALHLLAERNFAPRRATLARLSDGFGKPLDDALVLWLPGPGTATGEDTVEIHCHGGRAVIAAIIAELGQLPGLRQARAGEFTRRAFVNGRIDLAEAEGLADLLEAETELQRQGAMALAGGVLSRKVEAWRSALLKASAMVEAVLDFAGEDDVAELPEQFADHLRNLGGELAEYLAQPRAEALREGFRVVIAGPPNVGKSTLFNALVGDEAAIATPVPGTTRDVLQRSVAIEGVPFVFIDTAGLRTGITDQVEEIGVARARAATSEADLVLWLGAEGEGPDQNWEIASQIDRDDRLPKSMPRHSVSAVTSAGIDALRADLVAFARSALPKPGQFALNQRQAGYVRAAKIAIDAAVEHSDPLLAAEELRWARSAFDALIGRTATEDMLSTLFGRFCIGK